MGAYQRGDHGAFEELFARYAALVTGYMRRGYRSEHDAQDLTQQTFLHLHRGRHDYRAGAPLRPWLMTIARNVLRDRIRHTDPFRDRGWDIGGDLFARQVLAQRRAATELGYRTAEGLDPFYSGLFLLNHEVAGAVSGAGPESTEGVITATG